jgi:dihydropteroate synthase
MMVCSTNLSYFHLPHLRNLSVNIIITIRRKRIINIILNRRRPNISTVVIIVVESI